MAKLKTLRPAIQMLKPQLATHSTATDRLRGSVWMGIRYRVLMRDCGLCLVCQAAGRTQAAAEVDHITPLEQGGKDNEANLQSICLDCHDEKTKREAQERAMRAMHPTP